MGSWTAVAHASRTRTLILALAALLALLLGGCAGTGGTAGFSVAEIKARVATAKSLDGFHARANKPCETCHGSLPSFGTPTLPTTAKCLTCHGGTYAGHATRTARLGKDNPHQSHLGEVDCVKCHQGHRPFTLVCNECHSLSVPEKYRETT